MLHLLMFAALAAAQPTTATEGAAIPPVNEADIEMIVNQAMALQAKDANEDLKLLAAELKELAKQKQAMRDALQQLAAEQGRLSAAGPLRARQQHDWAVALPRLCPPGPQRADCIERHVKVRLDIVKASATQR